MKHLVIGLGEVGGSLRNFLNCDGFDEGSKLEGNYDVLHICFPYDDNFIENVKIYEKYFHPSMVIIHSTVPVGTTKRCGDNFVHSPIRGKHPHLEESLKMFTKFFGGSLCEDAATIFKNKGVEVVTTLNSENTEAMKLWDTEIYREAILLNKKIYEYCKKNNLDFDIVYTKANITYNEGYKLMGNPEFAKYVLKYVDGPIGGHCLNPNHDLLND